MKAENYEGGLLFIENRIMKLLRQNPIRHKQKTNRNKELLAAMTQLKPFCNGFNLSYFLNLFGFSDKPISDLTEYKNIVVVLNRLLKTNFKAGYVIKESSMFYFFE